MSNFIRPKALLNLKVAPNVPIVFEKGHQIFQQFHCALINKERLMIQSKPFRKNHSTKNIEAWLT